MPNRPVQEIGKLMVEKVPTGIQGFDEITDGGLPKGRVALVTGSPGTGKSMFGLEFLVRGASDFGEPGVFVSFEENVPEIIANGASLGFDLPKLIDGGQLFIDYVRVERSEIEETGEYDLEGLFIRLDYAISSVGAKRVVLDTIESLFAGLPNPSILRAELRRLFRWLKEKGMTTILTGERGKETLTREGLEEFVSDCVILLDHRVTEQVSTRRLRVVKYRGSRHGTNEYPFLMSSQGFNVLPITSLGLDFKVSRERVSSGIPRMDVMLDGKGYYRGSLILITGTAGTGKSSLASKFLEASCGRGERAIYFAFEESPDQIMRNMSSIGIDLKRHVDEGLLLFVSERPTVFGLEHHLMKMIAVVNDFNPSVVAIDPFSNLPDIGSLREVKGMIQRVVDFFKSRTITTILTYLTSGGGNLENTDVGISSLTDTWILLKDIESGGERNRVMHILKSRGMAHSNQVREYLLTSHGIDILDVYTGPGGVLTGSARLAQEARDRDQEALIRREIEGLKKNMEKRRSILEMQLAQVRSEFESEKNEIEGMIGQKNMALKTLVQDREEMAVSRKADERKK